MTSATALRLILCDINIDVVEALRVAFADCADVEVRWSDLVQVEADAYAAPTNTYGQISERLLQSLNTRFGMGLETRLVRAIMMAGGRMDMGNALVVETEHARIPYLIVTPTVEAAPITGQNAEQAMETAGDSSDTISVHTALNLNPAGDAMRALLAAAQETARVHPGTLASLACPGLCTGQAWMPPEVAARQMRVAVDVNLDE